MRYQDLLKEIKQQTFHPVYFFTGPEQSIANMTEKRLIEAAVSPATVMLNLMRFSDKETTMAEIIALCEQFPMMSPFRMVIVNPETTILSRKDEAEINKLLNYLKNPAPSTILLIKDPQPDNRKKIVKALNKSAALVEFKKLDRSDLETWILARLKKANKKASRNTIDTFINRSRYLENEGQNIEAIDHEVNKLIDFCGLRSEITPDDVEITLPPSIDENIYHMIDHFMSGHVAKALQMLRHFYLNGQDPIGVFALIVSQLRTILQIQILSRQGKYPQEIGTTIHRPLFVVKKLMQTSKKFPGYTLFDLMDEAAKVDWQIKTGAIEAAPAVELFLLKMVEAPR